MIDNHNYLFEMAFRPHLGQTRSWLHTHTDLDDRIVCTLANVLHHCIITAKEADDILKKLNSSPVDSNLGPPSMMIAINYTDDHGTMRFWKQDNSHMHYVIQFFDDTPLRSINVATILTILNQHMVPHVPKFVVHQHHADSPRNLAWCTESDMYVTVRRWNDRPVIPFEVYWRDWTRPRLLHFISECIFFFSLLHNNFHVYHGHVDKKWFYYQSRNPHSILKYFTISFWGAAGHMTRHNRQVLMKKDWCQVVRLFCCAINGGIDDNVGQKLTSLDKYRPILRQHGFARWEINMMLGLFHGLLRYPYVNDLVTKYTFVSYCHTETLRVLASRCVSCS